MARIQYSQIQGIELVSHKVIQDNRGALIKFFDAVEGIGPNTSLTVDSLIHTSNYRAGTVRGLHFQVGLHQEKKLITCLSGEIFDVMVDLRPESPSCGRWAAITLTESSPYSIFVPSGVAHGYQTQLPETSLCYAIENSYSPDNSYALDSLDGDLEIEWPLSVVNLSPRDATGLSLRDAMALMRDV
jgi:dTDP-4-dehydrorhamnose 3,5-epimerase